MSSTGSLESIPLDDSVGPAPASPMPLELECCTAVTQGVDGTMSTVPTEAPPPRISIGRSCLGRSSAHSSQFHALQPVRQYAPSGRGNAPIYAARLAGYQRHYAETGPEIMDRNMLLGHPYRPHHNVGPVYARYSVDERNRASHIGPGGRYESAAPPSETFSAHEFQSHPILSVDCVRTQPWPAPMGASLAIDQYITPNFARIPGLAHGEPGSTAANVHDPYLCINPCCTSTLRAGLTCYRVLSNGYALKVLPHMGTRGNFISFSVAELIGAVDDVPYAPWSKTPEMTYISIGDGDWATEISAHLSSALPAGCDLVLGLEWLKGNKAVPDWTNHGLRFQAPWQESVYRWLPEWA